MFFNRNKKQCGYDSCSSDGIDIRIGNQLKFHGSLCKITGILKKSDSVLVFLEFCIVEGKKRGTDGWYDLRKLKHDTKVCNAGMSEETAACLGKSLEDVGVDIGDTVKCGGLLCRVLHIKLELTHAQAFLEVVDSDGNQVRQIGWRSLSSLKLAGNAKGQLEEGKNDLTCRAF